MYYYITCNNWNFKSINVHACKYPDIIFLSNNSYFLFLFFFYQIWNSFIPGSNLRAVYDSSEITTSSITVRWTPPYLDPNLVQSYSVSLRGHQDSNYYDSASVHLQTSYMYTFYSSFIPSFNYYLEITSNILLSDPEETFSVKTDPITLHVIVGKTFINVSIYLLC